MLQDSTPNYDILISNYLDNTISPEKKQQLTAWVNSSRENKTLFVQTAKAWEKSTVELQDKLLARRRVAQFFEQVNRRKQRRLYRRVLSSAAAVLLIIAGITFYRSGMLTGGNSLVAVADNEKQEITLSDGTRVWLNTRSSLTYPSRFRRTREVKLSGEAIFDVADDKRKPFSVYTEDMRVDVYGTKFLITGQPDGNTAEIVLESGEIALTLTASGRQITLAPNQQLVYDRATGAVSLHTVNAADYVAWGARNLVFENAPLGEVFTQLEKWYNTDIQCSNDALLQTRVSFAVDAEPIEDILAILRHITALQWQKNDDGGVTVWR